MEQCAHCGASKSPTNPLPRCSRCKSVAYCSIECQVRHRRVHKVSCLPLKPSVGEGRKTEGKETTHLSSSEETSATNPPVSPAPSPLSPWQRARSMAASAYSGGLTIIDDLDDLKNSRIAVKLYTPKGQMTYLMTAKDPIVLSSSLSSIVDGVAVGVVMVCRLVSQNYHPFRSEWTVEDCQGKTSAHVRFELLPFQLSTFRLEDLQKGHFLCVREPELTIVSTAKTAGPILTLDRNPGSFFTFITVRDIRNVALFPPE